MTDVIKYGLLQSDIKKIVSIFENNERIAEVILFGSRAKGNFHNGSDIDIALKGKNLKLNDVLNASIEIDELMLPYKFDIIIYNKINENKLIDHINRVGISLFVRQPAN